MMEVLAARAEEILHFWRRGTHAALVLFIVALYVHIYIVVKLSRSIRDMLLQSRLFI